ncbi:flagellar hook-length control protein FliK [Arthrobacter sp.]|uniref:flagellar hook-length control protein FliK n=1 Tax=Arthrobacter sp. TaxID=1667 RepID=UPI003A94B80A
MAPQPTPAVPTVAPAAAPQQPEPLNRQLAGPIATLATGPHGDRTMTVNVAPDGLGPVTVKAHLGAEGLRVELTAPTDAGRDALRNLLGDLRRDLAVLGHGSVSLATADRHDPGPGTGNGQQPTSPGNGQQQGAPGHPGGQRTPPGQHSGTGGRGPAPDVVPVPTPPAGGAGSTGTTQYPARLDVLA